MSLHFRDLDGKDDAGWQSSMPYILYRAVFHTSWMNLESPSHKTKFTNKKRAISMIGIISWAQQNDTDKNMFFLSAGKSFSSWPNSLSNSWQINTRGKHIWPSTKILGIVSQFFPNKQQFFLKAQWCSSLEPILRSIFRCPIPTLSYKSVPHFFSNLSSDVTIHVIPLQKGNFSKITSFHLNSDVFSCCSTPKNMFSHVFTEK